MLDYVALGGLVFIAASLLFGAIAIVGIPHRIAEERNHPHREAIYYAGWISLFTLHVIWPFLWIWATLYREDRGWGFQASSEPDDSPDPNEGIARLEAQLESLSERLRALEQSTES